MAIPTVSLDALLGSGGGKILENVKFVVDFDRSYPFMRISDSGYGDLLIVNVAAWLDEGDTMLFRTAAIDPPAIKVISQAVTISDFTDGGGTSGYVDLDTQLPLGAIPLGCMFVVTGAFTGDTSAVVQAGISGDTDRFTEQIDQDLFGAGTYGSIATTDCADGLTAAQTIRVTVTSASDFALVVTDGTGAMTVYVYYIDTVTSATPAGIPSVSLDTLLGSKRGMAYQDVRYILDPNTSDPFLRISDAGYGNILVVNLAAWLDEASTGLAKVATIDPPVVNSISQSVAYGDFTDDTGSGYIDLDDELPANAIVLGCKFAVSTGFTGDVSATVQAGVAGDVDRFTEETGEDVFVADVTVGSVATVDAQDGMNAAQDIRVTVTPNAAWSSVSAGVMVVSVYYIVPLTA